MTHAPHAHTLALAHALALALGVALALLLAASASASAPASASASVSPSTMMTLDDVVAHAQEHAPAIVAARIALGFGEADVAEAAAALANDPQIAVAFGPRIGAASGFVDDVAAASVDVQASLQQQLEIAGEGALRRDVAAASRDVRVAQLNAIRALVAVDVRAAFYRALLAERRVALAESSAALAQELVAITDRRVAAGDLSPLAAPLARADLAQRRHAAVRATTAARERRTELARSAGAGAQQLDFIGVALTGELPALARVRDVDRLEQRALIDGPIAPPLRADRDRAQARAVLVEREAAWPKPALGASYVAEHAPLFAGIGGGGGGVGGGAGVAGTEHILLATLQLDLPFAGRRAADASRARTERDVAAALVLSSERDVAVRVWAAARTLDDAIALIEAMTVDGAALDDTVGQLKKAFDLGELDVLDVVAARDRLLGVALGVLDAQEQALDARAALERELGRALAADELENELAGAVDPS